MRDSYFACETVRGLFAVVTQRKNKCKRNKTRYFFFASFHPSLFAPYICTYSHSSIRIFTTAASRAVHSYPTVYFSLDGRVVMPLSSQIARRTPLLGQGSVIYHRARASAKKVFSRDHTFPERTANCTHSPRYTTFYVIFAALVPLFLTISLHMRKDRRIEISSVKLRFRF